MKRVLHDFFRRSQSPDISVRDPRPDDLRALECNRTQLGHNKAGICCNRGVWSEGHMVPTQGALIFNDIC